LASVPKDETAREFAGVGMALGDVGPALATAKGPGLLSAWNCSRGCLSTKLPPVLLFDFRLAKVEKLSFASFRLAGAEEVDAVGRKHWHCSKWPILISWSSSR